MSNRLSLFLSLILFYGYNFTGKAFSNGETSLICKEENKQAFIKFYKENKVKYNLLQDEQSLNELECYQLLDKSGPKQRNIVWMELNISESPSETKKLMIQLHNPLKGWQWVADNKCPFYEESLNKIINSESQEEKDARLQSYIKRLALTELNNFDASNYSGYFLTLYMAKITNLEKVSDAFYRQTVMNELEKSLPYLYTNFFELLSTNYTRNIEEYFSFVADSINQKLNEEVRDQLVELIKYNQDVIHSHFLSVIKIMGNLGTNVGFGHEECVKEATLKYDSFSSDKIFAVYNILYRNIKTQDYIKNKKVVPYKNDHNSEENVNKMIEEMKAYSESEIKFFFANLFAGQKINILDSKQKKAGIIEMLFYSKDNCQLTTYELTDLFQYAIQSQWILSSVDLNDPSKIIRGCNKTVNGNTEFFEMVINPTNTSRCQIVFEVNKLETENPIKILPDTDYRYDYNNSCKRDTIRIKKEQNSYNKKRLI